MSDYSKWRAEQLWQQHNDQVIVSSDVPDFADVLAENEQARFDAYVDAMSDVYDDGDED